MKKDELLKLIFSILICQFTGIIGSIFTSSSIRDWYTLINKPPFTPPNWIFAPVWTILFIFMGVSLWFILKKPKREKNVKKGIFLFGLQLLLNILWSFLFFYMKNPLLGFIDITLLWITVLFTIVIFMKIDRKAAFLLIPYLLWLTFAGILNFSIYILNI